MREPGTNGRRARRAAGAGLLALGAFAVWIGTHARSARADAASPAGDPVRGAVVYQSCMGCHSLDEDDVGPHHRGVVGRRAGALPDFAYSPALRNARFVWDAATLDRWLANPQQVVPGTRMFFAMPNPQDRADVIAYLATQR